MAMQPVSPDIHPTRLQRSMHAFRAEMHQTAMAARNEKDPDKALEQVADLADQVEYLG